MITENKFDRLNLLRLLAFLLVFLQHAKFFMPVQWDANVSWAWLLYTPAAAGVWIFFVLSGYGIGHGFYTGKYDLSLKGIMKFYISRIIKMIPVYWFWIVFVILGLRPDYLTPGRNGIVRLIKLFFFCYQEEFDYLEFGVAWFLTTLMRLYFCAPLGYWILRRYFEKKPWLFFTIMVIGGMFMRIVMGYHIIGNQIGTWSEDIYKPFIFNLDLFFCGFALNGIKKNRSKWRGLHGIPWIALLILVIYSCRIGYFGEGYITNWLNIYEYVLPTIYLLVTIFFILNYEFTRTYDYERLTKKAINDNKGRIIDLIAKLAMPLYLFHSTVFNILQSAYSEQWFMKIVSFLHIPLKYADFSIGIFFTIMALIYTVAISVATKWWIEPALHNTICSLIARSCIMK